MIPDSRGTSARERCPWSGERGAGREIQRVPPPPPSRPDPRARHQLPAEPSRCRLFYWHSSTRNLSERWSREREVPGIFIWDEGEWEWGSFWGGRDGIPVLCRYSGRKRRRHRATGKAAALASHPGRRARSPLLSSCSPPFSFFLTFMHSPPAAEFSRWPQSGGGGGGE